MKPFLITGMGRSGTKFIANALNQSKEWEVAHEHSNDDKYLLPNAKTPIERFRENYGEVNSMLRKVAPKLSDLGVNVILLVRDPKYIARSVLQSRSNKREDWKKILRLIRPGIEQVARLYESKKINGYYRFEELLINKDRISWCWLLEDTGIHDLDYDIIDFSMKLGSNGDNFPIPKHEDWTEEEKKIFRDELGYFTEKLGYDGFCDTY